MTIEAIKRAIEGLTDAEFVELGCWFDGVRGEAWDRQIEADSVPGGRAAALIERLDREIDGGHFGSLAENSCGGQGLSIDQYVIQAARNELAQPSSIGTPSLDPHLASALARTRAATAELVRQGIIDRDGNRLRTDMPEDMREGADRDFGG